VVQFRHVVGAVGVLVLTSSLAAAQAPAGGGQRAGGAPPALPKNLQVLPKDTPAPQVVALMRTFNTALGVQCGYCHMFVAPGDPTNDMAADTKTPKLVARVMMQMVSDVNAKLAANIKKPADQIAKVECATCHRGAAIPVLPPPAAAAPAGAGAPPAAAPPAPGR
jgi:Photosynthetic reaction centre cytochrome C subunit